MKTEKLFKVCKLSLPLFLALIASAQEPLFRYPSDFDAALTVSEFANIAIRCGDGQITINIKTGAVELPKGVPLDKAATEFWLAVAKAFPEARRQILEGGQKVK